MSALTPEGQRNQEIYIQAVNVKIEKEVDCMFEEESSSNGYKNSYKTLEPTNQLEYVNYYDSQSSTLEQLLKKEIPDNEYLQADYRISSKLVFEDTDLLTLPNSQKDHIVKQEEELPINSREENQVFIKIEKLEEQDVLDNAENTTIHYNVLVTPQKVNCKLCGRKFKNIFNLIKHNSEHIAVAINKTDINEINKLYQCQDCDKHFVNFDNMLSHVSEVHIKTQVKSETCQEQFNTISSINEMKLEKLPKQVNGRNVKNPVDCKGGNIMYKYTESCHTNVVNKKEEYKCTLCERLYISKHTLKMHTRKTHYDYGRTFDCWCGIQFPTAILLSEHKRLQHSADRKNKESRVKSNLKVHTKKTRRDYGRVLECGYRKHLRGHKYWQVADKSTYDVEPNYIVTRSRNI